MGFVSAFLVLSAYLLSFSGKCFIIVLMRNAFDSLETTELSCCGARMFYVHSYVHALLTK